MAFMEKWNEVSDNMFGDFTSDKNRYGILKNSPSDYYISRFNDSNRLDDLFCFFIIMIDYIIHYFQYVGQ